RVPSTNSRRTAVLECNHSSRPIGKCRRCWTEFRSTSGFDRRNRDKVFEKPPASARIAWHHGFHSESATDHAEKFPSRLCPCRSVPWSDRDRRDLRGQTRPPAAATSGNWL